ncbi:MAG: hypothetical protein ACXVAX_03340 [Pseudobdellovibrio sp.]
MKSNGLFIFVIGLFLTCGSIAQTESPRLAENTTEATDIFYICKNSKGSSRWLRAYRLDGGKCHTVYSKEGYLQIISSATYMTSCEGVLHNVRKNIEEGGYKCWKLDSYSYLEIE